MSKYVFLFSFLITGYLYAAPIEFRDYINIRSGLSEGALIEKVGPPDYTTSETVRKVTRKDRIADTEYNINNTKDMLWYADANTPYTTIVTIENGRVSAIQRKKNNKIASGQIQYYAAPK
ncbi:hypothetical protein [Neisseria sp. Ec49-e6-T10]|uniref:hypothetical protein n=1 Tax=Neisseria sp. Ec49-e6-T10 TaxID=3140744 RepID=UPI003EBC6130